MQKNWKNIRILGFVNVWKGKDEKNNNFLHFTCTFMCTLCL